MNRSANKYRDNKFFGNYWQLPRKSNTFQAPEPSIILKQVQDVESVELCSFMAKLGNLRRSDALVWALISIMLKYGLRISELLRINKSEQLRSGRFVVKGSKGSLDVILDLSDYSEILHFSKDSTLPLFGSLTRSSVYRIMKKNNLSFKSALSSKMSICHAPRHLFALTLRLDNVEGSMISQGLRHKSLKNRKYYGILKK